MGSLIDGVLEKGQRQMDDRGSLAPTLYVTDRTDTDLSSGLGKVLRYYSRSLDGMRPYSGDTVWYCHEEDGIL